LFFRRFLTDWRQIRSICRENATLVGKNRGKCRIFWTRSQNIPGICPAILASRDPVALGLLMNQLPGRDDLKALPAACDEFVAGRDRVL
jgi:hypothetical protein